MSDMVKFGRRVVHVFSNMQNVAILRYCFVTMFFAAWAASDYLFVPLLNLCLGVCLLQLHSFV